MKTQTFKWHIMKLFLLTLPFCLMSPALMAQKIHTGSLLGFHTVKMNLSPGVTPEQYIQQYREKVIPLYEESRPGWHLYMLKGIRGDHPEAEYGLLILIDSEQERDKYYNPDGTENEAGKASLQKIAAATEEMNKMGTIETIYTDWLVTGMASTENEIEIKPGELICPHTMKVSLQPGFSMDQYTKACCDMGASLMKYDPAWKSCTMKSLRGADQKDTFGVIYIVDSEKDRDKYYNPDGTDSEMGIRLSENLKPLMNDINKVGEVESETYTDWLVLPL